MTLQQLIQASNIALNTNLSPAQLACEVTNIIEDSRKVTSGCIFVAISGAQYKDDAFLQAAIDNGAAVILSESDQPKGLKNAKNLIWVCVPYVRYAYAKLAEAFYLNPSQSLKLVGVTGTNGKTTVTHLMHQVAQRLMQRAGRMSTISHEDGIKEYPSNLTTNTPQVISERLAAMVTNGCRVASMEVSSIGIEQQRVAALDFNVAIYTNLTQDHLDYHGTMQAYSEAKWDWFSDLAGRKGKSVTFVVNGDDKFGQKLIREFKDKVNIISYGTVQQQLDVRFSSIQTNFEGMRFDIEIGAKQYKIQTGLIGDFNAYNIAAIIGSCKALKLPIREVIQQIKTLNAVEGRMERVGQLRGVPIFVDYAHTPDALEKSTELLRKFGDRNLITVFGCGGDRDKTKRPLMARAASKYSDVCLITNDNPRTEDPQEIADQIAAGIRRGKRHYIILDRREAIEKAMKGSKVGDIILIAGKGHELYQEIDGNRLPFSDRYTVKELFKEVNDFIEKAIEDLKEQREAEEAAERELYIETYKAENDGALPPEIIEEEEEKAKRRAQRDAEEASRPREFGKKYATEKNADRPDFQKRGPRRGDRDNRDSRDSRDGDRRSSGGYQGKSNSDRSDRSDRPSRPPRKFDDKKPYGDKKPYEKRGGSSGGYKGKSDSSSSGGYKGKSSGGYKGKSDSSSSGGYKGKSSGGYKGKSDSSSSGGYKGKSTGGYKGKSSSDRPSRPARQFSDKKKPESKD